jgi:hypothetical protein
MHASLYASAPASSANGALPLDRARPTPFDYLDDENGQLPPGGVYSTEAYPTAFLPEAAHSADCTSSTDSTPVTSPTLYPSRRSNSNTSAGDAELHNAFALPSTTPSRIVRKPSKTLVSHRNSLLDPIVEEPSEGGR